MRFCNSGVKYDLKRDTLYCISPQVFVGVAGPLGLWQSTFDVGLYEGVASVI